MSPESRERVGQAVQEALKELPLDELQGIRTNAETLVERKTPDTQGL
jgi:hypothetical protein